MKIKILSRWSSAAVFSVEASSLYLALEAAVLRGAANLGGAKVLGVATVGYIDGWPTTLWRTDKGYRIQAGCHTFTLDEARAHYANRDARRGLYYLATEAWQVIARLQGWEQEPGADLASPGVTALLEETR